MLRRLTAYDIVRCLAAAVLLTAATLKGIQLATEPVVGEGLLGARWFQIGLVEWELVLGICLMVRLYPSITRCFAVVTFLAFALVALVKGLDGESSCACFGRVTMNPWATFAIDLVLLALLVVVRRSKCRNQSKRHMLRLSAAVAAVLLLGVSSAVAMASFRPSMLTEEGHISGPSRIVVLEPESWIGKPLPLLQHMDVGQQLSEGKWTVLLFRHDCARCERTLPRYQELAVQLAMRDPQRGVALIEVPPFDRWKQDPSENNAVWLNGKLAESHDWFVATPLEITLENGRTIQVRDLSRHEAASLSLGSDGGRVETVAGPTAKTTSVDRKGF